MIAFVARTFEDSEKDEASGYGSVQDAQEDQSRDHKGESHFLVEIVAQRSECGCSVVLSSGVSVNHGRHNAENNDLADGNSPQCLGEVLWIFHLSNEAGNGDLSNEGVADVQEGVHPTDEASACGCNNKDSRLAREQTGWPSAWSIVTGGSMFAFHTSEDSCQEN